MQNDCVDGIGHDGFDAAVAGRSGPGVARSPSGRCSAPAGAQVCSLLATSARLDGRLERLPQQYSPSVPREGQADQGGWTSMLAGLARVAHWHHELSKHLHVGSACTPAMAAGLTDHVWSICELLRYQIAPPLWVPPKRRGRPKKQPESVPPIGKRPRVRLRKGVLCLVTG